MGISADFLSGFSGKRVFITGHTGFKGAWLSAYLMQAGAIIKGYSLAPEYEGGLFDYLKDTSFRENIIADIRDKAKLEKEILSFAPDFIFHLAAQPLVRRSYKIPSETFEVNVVGTSNVLEAMTKLPNKCTAVIITTDKVYSNKNTGKFYKEDDVLGGYDPYSASKACTELVVNAFRSSFFNNSLNDNNLKNVATARAGNVIGGGDWSDDRLLPDIVRSLVNEKAIVIRNPGAIRPWQHVLEPLTGYLILASKLDHAPAQFSKAYNFGPGVDDHLQVKDMVEHAIKAWGNGEWMQLTDKNKLHEAAMLQLDNSLAKSELNWESKLSAKEAIEWTIAWYKKPHQDKLKFTLDQIQNYLSK